MATSGTLDKFPHFLNRSLDGNGYERLAGRQACPEGSFGAFRRYSTHSSVDADVSNFEPRLAQKQLENPSGSN